MDMHDQRGAPPRGRYVWRWGRLTYEAIVPMDGVVVTAVFLDGEVVMVWDEPAGEA